jgi:arsenite methyltransferase
MNSAAPGTEGTHDEWSEWLLGRRHGGDAAYQRLVLEVVDRIADRVLDGAQLKPGMTLADIGAGDGRIAFRAISRIGDALRVVLTDVSVPLLDHARELADQRGIRGQCTFVEGSAEKLNGLGDATVDVVTTRAVLAYVADKRAALREFQRVLRPGGRISMAEPIFQDEAFEASALRKLVEGQPGHPDMEFLRLLLRLKAAQFPSTEDEIWKSPITNYSERDLIRFVREAGFVDVHLELHIDVLPSLITTWDVYLNTSPHPWAPTIGRVLAEHFSDAERQAFERVLRPVIESKQSTTTDVNAYLTANKPR